MKKNKGGRPPEFDDIKIQKLEQAFSLDASIDEACFYAGISPQTYYNNIEKRPELVERFNALRNKPILKARQTLVGALDQPDYALKYLERKKRNEFALRTEVTGNEGSPLKLDIKNLSDDEVHTNIKAALHSLPQGTERK